MLYFVQARATNYRKPKVVEAKTAVGAHGDPVGSPARGALRAPLKIHLSLRIATFYVYWFIRLTPVCRGGA